LIACTVLLGLSLYGYRAFAGSSATNEAARIDQPAIGVLTLVRGGHGHHGGGHRGGGHYGGGHHGHAMHFARGYHRFHAFRGRHHGWYAGRWRHGGHWRHGGRHGYWRHGHWFWYGGGGGSCYWNCINAGFGPAYCSVNAWRFCY